MSKRVTAIKQRSCSVLEQWDNPASIGSMCDVPIFILVGPFMLRTTPVTETDKSNTVSSHFVIFRT